MIILDEICTTREHRWKVGDTFISCNDVYMICYDSVNAKFLLVDMRTGVSVFSHNTLEELCSDSIPYEALNINITTKIKIGGN